MAFIIEQEIKGNIYLYKVESQWDKVKKKTFQKRTYLGPKYPKNGKNKIKKGVNWVNKSYGNVFLLEKLAQQTGIYAILESSFPTCYKSILALAYYQICTADPFYLFSYWQEEHHLPELKKQDSSSISSLLEIIGKDEKQRFNCLEKWIHHLGSVNALYYDISSISSYATHLSFIEWGYNRDKDHLAQLNIGMVFCSQNRLPIYYHLYPGSIVDVSTLKNCSRYLNALGLQQFLFILDRGFFSIANVETMNQKEPDKIEFIIGLPFKLKKAKQLISKYKKQLTNIDNVFSYKNQIISHIKTTICFSNEEFDAHIFYNEKIALKIRHQLLSKLLELEASITSLSFNSLKEWKLYRDKNIVEKYRHFFKWNTKTKKAQKNVTKIKAHINTAAYFILMTNKKGLDAHTILSHYFNKDAVEKVFDGLKNELDAKRLRTHNDFTSTGKLFVIFIALIIQSEIIKIMNENNLFKLYTVKELLLEMKKIKINQLQKDKPPIVSELSKKQKKILKIFNLKIIHGY